MLNMKWRMAIVLAHGCNIGLHSFAYSFNSRPVAPIFFGLLAKKIEQESRESGEVTIHFL